MSRPPTSGQLAASDITPQNHDRIDPALPPVPPITPTQTMISAMTGSLLTSLLVTPLDVVRVRLQSQKPPVSAIDFSKLALTPHNLTPIQTANLGVTACCREVFFAGNNAEFCLAAPQIEGIMAGVAGARAHDCAVQEVEKKTYKSTIDGLRKIARNEGVTTLWRGLSPTLVMTIPANIIYFTGYDNLRYHPKSPLSNLSSDYAPLAAGSIARVIAVAAVGPIELFRTRIQASGSASGHFMETLSGIKAMVAAEGYASLWRGFNLTLWRDVPFSSLYWWGYETLRTKFTDMREERRGRSLSRDEDLLTARRRSRSNEKQAETFLDSFSAGALSGAFASIVTMPFDVGKTRTQIYSDGTPRRTVGTAAGAAPEEQNMIRLLWHIFKTEGAAGLWRGWIPRTLKVAPACAIMISSYEVGKRAFRSINEHTAHKRQLESDR
ncbi:Mitochondrial carrier domain protein [Cordyceps fumosorosea ARSEF 2679]|uniref:Mitochondrial carrier domain protein n=1 Tax=Cordyceps fumosorosea (strain ARSEF 2679) TaxID=1081104 RepID=A0A162J156_CORFA|nr:Mitochondrial carrier domain protein [Cordyceps fumosorosea ARSEF 2679]OAA62272.1 Mitochondrial carrier domain protein [Cordyceps fumosorosea ARSEF 2679]